MKLSTMHLIRYGSESFDRTAFTPIENKIGWVKPYGGLWASPVGSEWGWKQWCVSEEFHLEELEKSFEFNYTGNIFVIDSEADAKKMPVIKDEYTIYFARPDFEKMQRSGYDAIHLTVNGQDETRFSRECCLYGWDCESVLIMNPAGIKPIEKLLKRAINY